MPPLSRWRAGTDFDPDAIAEHYWRLHAQPPAEWETQFGYAGPG
jgi:hypothetical protein